MVAATVLKGSKTRELRHSRSVFLRKWEVELVPCLNNADVPVSKGVWGSEPNSLNEQPRSPTSVDQVSPSCSFRLPDPAPDSGGNYEQNRSSASGNCTKQKRPVWGTRLAFIWGGRGRPKRGREYFAFGSPLRVYA